MTYLGPVSSRVYGNDGVFPHRIWALRSRFLQSLIFALEREVIKHTSRMGNGMAEQELAAVQVAVHAERGAGMAPAVGPAAGGELRAGQDGWWWR